MAALSAEMTTAADTAGVPKTFRKFLIAQEILTPYKFGLLASAESEVAKEIIEVATSGGIKFELKDKVAIKELWMVYVARVLTQRLHPISPKSLIKMLLLAKKTLTKLEFFFWSKVKYMASLFLKHGFCHKVLLGASRAR